MVDKEGLLLKIGIVFIVVIMAFGIFTYFSSNNDVTIPTSDVVVGYTGYSEYDNGTGCVAIEHGVKEIRDKTGENSTHIFYEDAGEHVESSLRGHFTLTLTEDNINGSSQNLEVLKSAFAQMDEDSHGSILQTTNSYELNKTAFNGSNAYLTFYKENGDVFLTKQLDTYYFTCYLNPMADNNTYHIEFINTDAKDLDTIYSNEDLRNTVDFCMIFNSSGELYELKLPLDLQLTDTGSSAQYI